MSLPESFPASGNVTLDAVLEAPELVQLRADGLLPVGLGMNASGSAVGLDLASIAVLLVTGPDGMGKSVSINALLCSLLMWQPPSRLRLVLFDPTGVELTQYAGVPHLLSDVIRESGGGREALRWAVELGSARLQKFRGKGARGLREYNQRVGEGEDEAFVVVVLDEAELLLQSDAAARRTLAEIADTGLETGIHLVVATGGIPLSELLELLAHEWVSVLGFGRIDPQLIEEKQEESGTPLSSGSGLFRRAGSRYGERLLGARATDSEIAQIANHWRAQASPEYAPDLQSRIHAPGHAWLAPQASTPAPTPSLTQWWDDSTNWIARRVFDDHPGLDPEVSALHPSIEVAGSRAIETGALLDVLVTNGEARAWDAFEVAAVIYGLETGATVATVRRKVKQRLTPGEQMNVTLDVDVSGGQGPVQLSSVGVFVAVTEVLVGGEWL